MTKRMGAAGAAEVQRLEARVADLELHVLHMARALKWSDPEEQQGVLRDIINTLAVRERALAEAT